MKRTGYTKMRKWMNGLFMVLMALALGTCSKDDLTVPDSVPIPSPGTDKGEVTFEISSNGGTGSGTSTSPIEIGPDAALNTPVPSSRCPNSSKWNTVRDMFGKKPIITCRCCIMPRSIETDITAMGRSLLMNSLIMVIL